MPRPYARRRDPRVRARHRHPPDVGQWWAEYDAESADEAELTGFFAGGVFASGLAALRERFA
jgi:hypothetical protein